MQRLLEAGLILCGALAIFLLTALLTLIQPIQAGHKPATPKRYKNTAGVIGAWFADILLFCFGALAYSIPFVVVGFGYIVFHRPRRLLSVDYLTLGLRNPRGSDVSCGGYRYCLPSILPIFITLPAGGLVGSVVTAAMLPYFNLGAVRPYYC